MGTVKEWDVETGWNCPACRTFCPGLKGAEQESLSCVKCGREKTEGDAWVLPDEIGPERAVTGQAAEWAAEGEAKYCAFCGAAAREHLTGCYNCGAPYSATTTTPAPRAVALPPALVVPPSSTPLAAPSLPPPPSLRGQAMRVAALAALVGLGVAVLAGLVVGVQWLLVEESIVVEASALDWERTFRWQVRHEYNGMGWADNATSTHHVVSWGVCETRQSGVRPCNPQPCNCRPNITCNCTGGESYDCPPCVGGGTRDCNCRPTGAHDCNCRRTVSDRRNGSARVTERCDTCYSGQACDTCRVPRVCNTCRTPRVCQRCPRDTCDTCYSQCPVFNRWCAYRYDQWEPQPDITARGPGQNAMWWPSDPADGSDTRSQRVSHYWITYREVGPEPRTWRVEVGEGEYLRTVRGARFAATRSHLGRLTLGGRRP